MLFTFQSTLTTMATWNEQLWYVSLMIDSEKTFYYNQLQRTRSLWLPSELSNEQSASLFWQTSWYNLEYRIDADALEYEYWYVLWYGYALRTVVTCDCSSPSDRQILVVNYPATATSLCAFRQCDLGVQMELHIAHRSSTNSMRLILYMGLGTAVKSCLDTSKSTQLSVPSA